MATTRIHIGPADHGRRMTLDEFRDAEEEPGYRYELARGVLEVTEVPNDPHGYVIWNLYHALTLYDRSHPGIIDRGGGASEFRLWMPGMISGRNPDAAVVLRGTPRDMRGRRPPAPARRARRLRRWPGGRAGRDVRERGRGLHPGRARPGRGRPGSDDFARLDPGSDAVVLNDTPTPRPAPLPLR